MHHLTLEERQIAAHAASAYPPGFGFQWVAAPETDEDLSLAHLGDFLEWRKRHPLSTAPE